MIVQFYKWLFSEKALGCFLIFLSIMLLGMLWFIELQDRKIKTLEKIPYKDTVATSQAINEYLSPSDKGLGLSTFSPTIINKIFDCIVYLFFGNYKISNKDPVSCRIFSTLHPLNS
jgi:hypothetical protein